MTAILIKLLMGLTTLVIPGIILIFSFVLIVNKNAFKFMKEELDVYYVGTKGIK